MRIFDYGHNEPFCAILAPGSHGHEWGLPTRVRAASQLQQFNGSVYQDATNKERPDTKIKLEGRGISDGISEAGSSSRTCYGETAMNHHQLEYVF